jgi:hypothetical protein
VRWFLAWTLVGGAAALGFVSLGVLALAPAAVAGGVLASRPVAQRSAPSGVALGTGLLLLAVAWVQRDGPGTTCWQTATASGCDQHLDPLPWLAAGALLVAGGLIGLVRLSRSAS